MAGGKEEGGFRPIKGTVLAGGNIKKWGKYQATTQKNSVRGKLDRPKPSLNLEEGLLRRKHRNRRFFIV